MGVISINIDIMSPKKRRFAVSAFFCLTPVRQELEFLDLQVCGFGSVIVVIAVKAIANQGRSR